MAVSWCFPLSGPGVCPGRSVNFETWGPVSDCHVGRCNRCDDVVLVYLGLRLGSKKQKTKVDAKCMRRSVVAAVALHALMALAAANRELSLKTTVKLRRGSEMPMFGYCLCTVSVMRVFVRGGSDVGEAVHSLGTWLSEGGGTCNGAVKAALDEGYRLIDTATMYQNEADVGSALQESSAAGIYVVSKLQPSDHGREAALQAIDRTLAELKVDKLDLWLMHSPTGGKVVETWKAMLEVGFGGCILIVS